MLEFIVLGLIPGTQVQLTFNGVLLITAILLTAVELYFLYQRHKFAINLSIFTKFFSKTFSRLHQA